jgi:hypothetical protein
MKTVFLSIPFLIASHAQAAPMFSVKDALARMSNYQEPLQADFNWSPGPPGGVGVPGPQPGQGGLAPGGLTPGQANAAAPRGGQPVDPPLTPEQSAQIKAHMFEFNKKYGGGCDDPGTHCFKISAKNQSDWDAQDAAKAAKKAADEAAAQAPSLKTDPPILPTYPIETAVLGVAGFVRAATLVGMGDATEVIFQEGHQAFAPAATTPVSQVNPQPRVYRFYRVESSTQRPDHATAIETSGNLQGSAPRGSDFDQVQGYWGDLPPGTRGMQLETTIPPGAAGDETQGAMMRWYRGAEGVTDQPNGRVSIPVRVIENSQR